MKSGLLKAAMLGTGRSSSRTDVLGNPPHDALHRVWHDLHDLQDPADALLKAATVEYLTTYAGVSPTTIDLPMACAEETRRYVSVQSAAAFIDLAENAFTPFINEWINVVFAANQLATPRLLPQLLAFGQANIQSRSLISAIAGHRGRWLAAQLNKWPWLASDEQPSVNKQRWHTGSIAERLSWLLVKVKTEPEVAALAIAESWPGESPDARESIVGLVANQVAGGVDSAHETWLQEKALPDRRQNIRRLAIRALMKIPDSGFRQRSLQRAAELVQLDNNRFAQQTLVCEPPQHFRAEWSRDGLKEQTPSGSGRQDYWMLQILSVVPLQDWPELVGHNNPLSLNINADWASSVVKAWQNAALIHPDAASLVPLLTRLTRVSDVGVNIGILTSLLECHSSEVIADLLEPLKIAEGRCLELMRKTQPMLDRDKHKKLHQVACNWVFTDQHLAKNDAIFLASCCDKKAIPDLLEKISNAKALSASAEEFTRGLECRQSYLKHFRKSEELAND